MAVLVVLELSALLGSSTREWQEYSRIGTCYLPQVVYEEIEFLTSRAPEPEQERTAREFMRFFPNSGWQLTGAYASHPALSPPTDKTPSKQARLLLAVAQCTYGLSQEHPSELVVLVSNVQPLLQRLQAMAVPNLGGITRAALLQWVRTGQRPPAITQQLQALSRGQDARETAPRTAAGQPQTSAATVTGGPASAARRNPSVASQTRPAVFVQLVSSLLGLLGLAIAGLIAWRVIQPASFNQFWHQLGLPPLPGQPVQKSK